MNMRRNYLKLENDISFFLHIICTTESHNTKQGLLFASVYPNKLTLNNNPASIGRVSYLKV